MFPRLHALAPGALLTLAALVAAPAAHASTPSATLRPAIVGGAIASPGAQPSLAFVSGQFANGSGESCSGTVVAPDLILTAGHCAENILTGVPYRPQDLEVITGRENLSDDSEGQELTVSHVWVNPGFHPPSETGDAALLQLTRQTRAPALPLDAEYDPSGIQTGSQGAVFGWGKTSGTATGISQQLKTASLAVQTQSNCQTAWGDTFDTGSQFCVLDPPPQDDAGVCSGDSGGPFIQDVGGVPTEVGLAIYVAGDCSTAVPDVFTRTDSIAGWAEQQIAAVGQQGKDADSMVTDAMTPAVAYARSKRLMYHLFRSQLGGLTELSVQCVRLDRSGFLCSAAWQHGSHAFGGSIAVAYAIVGNQEVVTHRSTVREIDVTPTGTSAGSGSASARGRSHRHL